MTEKNIIDMVSFVGFNKTHEIYKCSVSTQIQLRLSTQKIMQILNLRVFQKKSRNDFSLRLRIQQVVYDQLFSDACNDARQIICLEIQQYWSWKQLRHSSVNTDKCMSYDGSYWPRPNPIPRSRSKWLVWNYRTVHTDRDIYIIILSNATFFCKYW